MPPRSDITSYFRRINNWIARCRAIETQVVHAEKRTPVEGYLRGELGFKDGSRLHFRELVTTEPSTSLVSYTYQYMQADGKLIFRYDDTDHFPNLPGAPHHKHLGETEVIAVQPPSLQTVLQEIEGLISKR